jgi:hypothetical protein
LPNKLKEKEKKNMKYKALLLSLLMLLPLGFIAAPRTSAMQQVQPELGIIPRWSNFTGPCINSTTFTIDVQLFNDPLSGVDVYAFDFWLSWGPEVSLVSATYHSPWANVFEVANKTVGNTYHLALTAIPPSEGLTTVKMSVLTLTFHIDVDICWPDTLMDAHYFHIYDYKMVADGGVVIPITQIEVDDGGFKLKSAQPNIELTSTAANATGWIIKKCNSQTFDVEVDLTNVSSVYGFSFILAYDETHLETDVQKITLKAAFPPPYEILEVVVGPNPTYSLPAGELLVWVLRPCEKPTTCGAVVPAIDIIFHTNFDTDDMIPVSSITPISIINAIVYAKCNDIPTSYVLGVDLLYGGDLTYYFKPSMYDLNLDCVVDVQDLKILVPAYGTVTAVGGYGDLFPDLANPQLVDIYDFVAVAKHFGPVDP